MTAAGFGESLDESRRGCGQSEYPDINSKILKGLALAQSRLGGGFGADVDRNRDFLLTAVPERLNNRNDKIDRQIINAVVTAVLELPDGNGLS